MASPALTETFHVFVTCPNDMSAERAAVRTFFESVFNQTVGRFLNLRFEVIDWDSCAHTGLGEPQALINEQLLVRYRDSLVLAIGVMGQRFGTPTSGYGAGTEAEFEWLAAHYRDHGHPEVKWFFRRIDAFVAAPNTSDIRDAMRQWMQVQRFRARYKGLYREFRNSNDFVEVLAQDVFRWFGAWIERRRAPFGSTAERTATASVPDFLDNRVARTLRIIAALQDVAKGDSGSLPCIRICAATSSLAIAESSAFSADDQFYLRTLTNERDLVERLFKAGAELKVLLTWNAAEMVERQGRNPGDVLARLGRLRAFFELVMESEEATRRIQIVHASVRERNVLIIGERCLFEGRKLSVNPGFEATTVVSSKQQIRQEIQMFDMLFAHAVRGALGEQHDLPLLERNRLLIGTVLDRIARDEAALVAGV